MQKPGWKTTELYLALAAVGALVWILQQLQTDLPAMLAGGPTWAVGLVPMAQLGIGAAIAGLGKWYMDHRKELKLAANIITAGPAITAAALPSGESKASGRVQVGALLLLLALTASIPFAFGCAHTTPFEHQIIQCAEGEGMTLVSELLPLLAQQDWPDAIAQAVKAGGEAAICALQFIANGQLTADAPHYQAGANAKAWLQAHAVTVKGK
jgi:hypothetical protein